MRSKVAVVTGPEGPAAVQITGSTSQPRARACPRNPPTGRLTGSSSSTPSPRRRAGEPPPLAKLPYEAGGGADVVVSGWNPAAKVLVVPALVGPPPRHSRPGRSGRAVSVLA